MGRPALDFAPDLEHAVPVKQPESADSAGHHAGRAPWVRIFVFWMPLASTWLMMAVEGPLLAALISRLAEPKFNLAAYGVALSFALLIEAPVIMMMSASTALVDDLDSYRKLRNFTFALNLAVTGFQLLLVTPPVFRMVFLSWIGLVPEVAWLTHAALIILLPWPGVIGYRRFYQGIMIRSDQTRRVAYGTVIRLSAMGLTAALLFGWSAWPGAWMAAAALSAGVCAEAVASRWMVREALARLPRRAAGERLDYRRIWEFYSPLALTSLLSMGIHPLMTLLVARSRLGLESLAVLPVVNSLVFVFRSLGLAYQEVAIALIGRRWEGYLPLRNFAAGLALASSAALAMIAFSPLRQVWFQDVSGLDAELSGLAAATLQWVVAMPALSIWLSFQRAMLVNLRVTRWITAATVLEVGALAAVLVVAIGWLDAVGALATAAAMVTGRLLSCLLLVQPLRREISGRVVASSRRPAPGAL